MECLELLEDSGWFQMRQRAHLWIKSQSPPSTQVASVAGRMPVKVCSSRTTMTSNDSEEAHDYYKTCDIMFILRPVDVLNSHSW